MNISIRRLFATLIVLLICTPVIFADDILKTGVTYEARQFFSKGDFLGIVGPEYHSIEITTYNDGTVRGVYKVSLKEFDGDTTNRFNLKGSWENASLYDKKLIKISLFDSNDRSYILYIDQNQNAYFEDISNNPSKLYLKSDLDAEKNAQELQKKAYQEYLVEKKRTEVELEEIMQQMQEYYEIVDLGLSVKWANLNDINLSNNHHWGRGCQLDYIGHVYIPKRERPYDEFTFTGAKSYYKKMESTIKRELLYCSDIDYIAGGKKFGDPMPYHAKDNRVREEFCYKYKKLYGKTTLTPQQTEELNKYCEIEHYPTTFEWKELMDNCYVAGVEEHSLKKEPAYIKFINYYQDGDLLDILTDNKDYHNNRLLRLVSKINGNSIVLPFNLKTGTNYRISQRLSTDLDKCNVVHVDATGLSFVEIDIEDYEAGRLVYGDVNFEALKEGIQKAREKYAPYALEQKKLAQEYEEQLMENVLILGAPSVEAVDINKTGESVKISIKAPIVSGKATKDSRVLVYIDKDPFISSFNKYVNHDSKNTAKIIDQDGQNPAYIEYEDWVSVNSKHYFFFLSLNFDNKYAWSKSIGGYYFDPRIADFRKGFLEGRNEYNARNSTEKYKTYPGLGISNKFAKIDRRFVKQSLTHFSVSDKNEVTYIRGPQPPAPKIGTPYVINLGTKKGKNKVTYQDVEVGFSVEEENYPFEHPRAENYSMSVMENGKDLKLIDCGISGNIHRYIIKKMEAMVPYSFEGIVWCQHHDRYSNKVEIIVDNNGNITTKDMNFTEERVQE